MEQVQTICLFTGTFVCKWHRFNLPSKPSLEITAQACLRGYCALEIAVEHTFEATVRSNSLRKRLAKRHCRLHGSTVSAKSETEKINKRIIRNGHKGDPLMGSTTHVEGPLADGFPHIVALRPQARKD